MKSCRPIKPWLEPYVDGELSAERAVAVEQHIGDCATCLARVRVMAALKTSTREMVREAVRVSPGFEERVRGALAAARAREAAHEPGLASGWLPWRTILPVAAAAAVTLIWAASVDDHPEGYSAPAHPVAASVTDQADQLIDELLRVHARGGDDLSPSVAEPSLVGQLEPAVGVPVRAPSLAQYGASWVSGTVVRVSSRGQHAALLKYRLGDRRVSVYIYDASHYPLRARLEPRVVRDVPVYVGQRRGYSIAATERRGVGYAATADLDDQATAELIAAAYP